MDSAKFVGMDVHTETISIAVMNSIGKLVMECIIETKASTILRFIQGLRGNLHVTFEEGTWAVWLYDLLKPHVTEVVVCTTRKTALLKKGSKSDRINARKLAEQRIVVVGLPRREWRPRIERIVPQLFDNQQGPRARQQSGQAADS